MLLWDTMKMQIRSSSLKYAKEKRAKLKSKEKSLESDISCLQKKLEENNLSETDKNYMLDELEVKTLQLQKISQDQTRGAIVRSKARWYHEGEKKHEVLLKFRKTALQYKDYQTTQARYNNSVINPDEILKEAKSFYEKYSTCNPQITSDYNDIFFPESFNETVDEQAQKECEGLLTSTECFESLKTIWHQINGLPKIRNPESGIQNKKKTKRKENLST